MIAKLTDRTQGTPDDFEMNYEGRAATLRWWSDRRLRYNAGLLVACAVGIILWVTAVSRCIDLKVPGDWEVSGFTLVGQAVISAVMIALANVFYWLGPWSDGSFGRVTLGSIEYLRFGSAFGSPFFYL